MCVWGWLGGGLGNAEETQSVSMFVRLRHLSFFFSFVLSGGLKVTCEYMAQQEGVLCEEVLLLSETNEDVCVKVKVHARVMGEVTSNSISLFSSVSLQIHMFFDEPFASHFVAF